MKSIFKSGFPLISLCLLVSCHESLPDSKSKSKSEGPTQNEVAMVDGSNISGIYSGELWPVNHNLHFKDIGVAALERDGDTFSAKVLMKYGTSETAHRQAIYTGRRCPNLTDDLNKDAYIDIIEAKLAIGKISIPLDGDLDSQLSGLDQKVMGDINGKFFYKNSASFDRMFSDLKAPDERPNDDLIKLADNDGLTFPGRIIVIHGLSEKIALPASVATTDDESVHQSIPVACAVLWKVPLMPGPLAELNENL